MRNLNRLSTWLIAFAVVAISLPQSAAAQTCNFTIVPPVYDSGETSRNLLDGIPTDTFGSFTADCTGTPAQAGTVFRVCPHFGAGSGGATSDGAVRSMASGANKANFNLYQDASRAVVWGSALGDMGSTLPPQLVVTLGSNGSGSANVPLCLRSAKYSCRRELCDNGHRQRRLRHEQQHLRCVQRHHQHTEFQCRRNIHADMRDIERSPELRRLSIPDIATRRTNRS
jgi:spore coat protein U-like protein